MSSSEGVADSSAPAGFIELTKPYMDPIGFAGFDALLDKATIYLEYGSGGSTVYAAKQKPNISTIISIDTDAQWVENVRLNLAGAGDRISLNHANVGPVVEWGRPRDRSAIDSYHLYATKPWEEARRLDVEPDLIMVDGRFRVACFLYSLVCARQGATLVLDDYIGRDHYKIVEEFCPLVDVVERTGVFTVHKTYDLPLLMKQFARYSLQAD